MEGKKQLLVVILVSINLILILPMVAFITIFPHAFAHQFQPNSQKPQMTIDSENNVHIHFISYIDYPYSYNVAYAMIDKYGRIRDGPRIVHDYPMDRRPDESVTEIRDSGGNWHYVSATSSEMEMDPSYIPYLQDEAFLFYTKVDRDGNVLVDEEVIAQHPKTYDYVYGPHVTKIKVDLDGGNNIHIAWCVNTGPGSYYEVFYMNLDNDGNVLVPQTRLYVFDYSALPGYLLILAVLPIVSGVVYVKVSRRISATRYSKEDEDLPLTVRTKLGGLVLLGTLITSLVSLLLFLLAPDFEVILHTGESGRMHVPVGFIAIFLLPIAFLLGHGLMVLDRHGKMNLWHTQVVRIGFISSVISLVSSVTILDSMLHSNSLWHIYGLLFSVFCISMIVVISLSIERVAKLTRLLMKRREATSVDEEI